MVLRAGIGGPGVPVPERVACNTPVEPLSVRVAVRAPRAEGVKFRVNVHEPEAARLPEQVVPDRVKSAVLVPPMEMP